MINTKNECVKSVLRLRLFQEYATLNRYNRYVGVCLLTGLSRQGLILPPPPFLSTFISSER